MVAGSGEQFIRVPIPLWDDARLTGSEILVMIALLRYYNREQRRSWPSQARIAKESRLSEIWVRKVLKDLEERGYIKAFRDKGRGNFKTYAISTLPKDEETETQFRESESELRMQGEEKPKVSFERPKLSYGETETEFRTNRNSVTPNQIKKQIKKQISEPEGRLASPDPWTRDQLAAIRQVVTAPRPAKLPELLAQWRETYGAQVVEQTIRKALRWMQDNGRQYTDMGRFLGRWLARDAERATPRKFSAPDYGDKPKSWRELMPAFYEEEQHDGQ